jgi:hypothetical protein
MPMWFGASNPKKSELISYVGRDEVHFQVCVMRMNQHLHPYFHLLNFKNKNKTKNYFK